MAENTEKKTCSCRKRIFVRIICIVLAVVVLLAVLLIGTVPARQVKETASLGENIAVMNVVSKLSNSLFTKDGKIAAKSTVELTSDEVNAVIWTAIRAYQLKHSGPGDAVLFGELKNGKILLSGGQPFLGSLSLNGRCAVIPTIADRKLSLAFSDLRAGHLPLPGNLAAKIAEKFLKDLEKTPEYQSAMTVILELKINAAGNLELTFIPSRIATLLTPLMQR